ncbi:hypothetical protein ACS0TY_015142 [Phlomoides rotata]
MSAIVWNARGLGGRRAFLNLQCLVDESKPCFIFIYESKICSTVASRWASLLHFSSCFCVDPRGRSGGLIIMWNESVSVSLRSYSNGHIDCSIQDYNSSWRFTGFYGNPAHQLRKFSWDLLRRLLGLSSSPSEPWLIGGDFNEIKCNSEKKGGGRRALNLMADFDDVLDELGMRELITLGPKFTWLNKRTGRGRIWEKLDRFVANDSWCERFPNAVVSNGDFYGSDHRAIKIRLLDRNMKEGGTISKRFMYENKWQLETGYKEAVQEAWAEGGTGSKLVDRLNSCSRKLQTWASENSGGI